MALSRPAGVVGMLERYRVLGAMLALGEFTVSELVAMSDVREPTVRTILRRESHYIEEIGTVPTGRRGGQPVRWRLQASTREQLRVQLQRLEQLGVGPWLGESQDPNETLPAGIIAAEHVLLHLAPSTDPIERAGLIKLARAHMDAADASGAATLTSGAAKVAQQA